MKQVFETERSISEDKKKRFITKVNLSNLITEKFSFSRLLKEK